MKLSFRLLATLLILGICYASSLPFFNDLALPKCSVADRQVVRTDDGLNFFQGLTLDPCASLLDCTDGRVCIRENDDTSLAACHDGRKGCYCSPPSGRRYCHESTRCDEGETCVQGPGSSYPFCASKLAVAYDPELRFTRRSVEMRYDGLTFEPCSGLENCNSGRECAYFPKLNRKEQCTSGQKCFCYPTRVTTCFDSIQCDIGETCASINGADRMMCVSRKAAAYVNAVVPFSMHKKEKPSPEAESEGMHGKYGLRGMTGDYCQEAGDCVGGRVCKLDLESDKACTGDMQDGDANCVCKPEDGLMECKEPNDCEAREVCAKLNPEEDKYMCVSTVTAGTTEGVEVLGKMPRRTRGAGLGLFPCKVDSDNCKEGFTCTAADPESFFNGDKLKSCAEAQEERAKKRLCMCIPDNAAEKKCKMTSDCKTEGELCARMPKRRGPRTKLGFCVSEDVEASLGDVTEVSKLSESDDAEDTDEKPDDSENPDGDKNPASKPDSSGDSKPTGNKPGPKPSGGDDNAGNKEPKESLDPEMSPEQENGTGEEGTCIDVDLLGHLSDKDLVFESHSLSKVLCDKNGSCATPGHMVRFKGKPMMMKSYCELATCVESMKLVNSPRYKIGLNVPSKTEGLVFTAFAARYETRVEEVALTAAVHVGL